MEIAAVSAVMKEVIGRLTSPAISQFGLLWGLKDDVSALKNIFSQIEAVLHDADVKQRKQKAVENWLRSLRSATLEAENVLDQVSTEAMLQRLHEERGIKYRVRAFFSTDHNLLMVRLRIAHKVKNIRRKLDVIADNGYKFGLTQASTSADAVVGGEIMSRETSSLLPSSKIYGRDAEKEMVAQKICNNDVNGVGVYAIWGIGGVGKTTLTQLVYNHERVKTHFKLKCWVYVSREFDVKKLTRGIIESIDGCPCPLSQLDSMQESLQAKLRGKRFLIVLDDIWNEDRTKWEELFKALSCGAEGSIVMVTTRMQGISRMMAMYPAFQHELGRLSEDDSWSLFKKLAFGGGREGGNIRELEPIGKEIVEKCKGLPLAVRTFGILMWSKSSGSEWQLVNKSEIWELEENDDYMLHVLKLSYDDLRPHLKRCFAYCCLFPKGYKMDKELLIELWMANGFIPSRAEADLYALGEDIFNRLVWRSFFQDVQDTDSKNQTCKMHDLMHDLARFVMRHDCTFREPDKEMIAPDEVLHLSSSCPDFIFSEKLRSLRSIIIFVEEYTDIISQIFKHKHLRVLHLTQIGRTTLPESICKLKYLRYLNMSKSYIKILPESIIYLQNLQVLLLQECRYLGKLPAGMRYLRNLQRLDIRNCDELRYMPVGMKELAGLRVLPYFIVGGENGAKIGEVGNLNLLGGEFALRRLDEVEGLEEAKSANLKYKRNLTSLLLLWEETHRRKPESQRDEEVLEGLEPNSSLNKLQISFHSGKKISPSWMVNLRNLVKISFRLCENCDCIPPLGKLPSLRVIRMDCMGSLERFHFDDNTATEEDISFPFLQKLYIYSCPQLASLPNNLPKLQRLHISDCNKLVVLPDNLPTLENLEIHLCNGLVSLPNNLPKLSNLNIRTCNTLVSLPSNLPTLKRLEVSECHGLVSLPCNLPMLERLEISECHRLVSLPSNLPILARLNIHSCDGLVTLPSNSPMLNRIHIYKCNGLVSLPNNLPILERLDIYNCSGLVSLPSNLPILESLKILSCNGLVFLPSNLPKLRKLVLRYCDGLFSLPDELLSLKELTSLTIWECEKLTPRYKKGIGEDWLKISHIPELDI